VSGVEYGTVVERPGSATVTRSVFPNHWGPPPSDPARVEAWVKSWATKEHRARVARDLARRRLQLLDLWCGPGE
jgi:hypothetical protein